MKITREEFKELIALHKEVDQITDKYAEVLNDKAIEKLAYPALNWITEKLELDSDMLFELLYEGKVVIDCDFDDDGFPINCVYSSDLDEIYDAYVNNEL